MGIAVDGYFLVVENLARIEWLERALADAQTALISRGDIGVAKGILMERFSLSEEQAFSVLQRVSAAENVKLREIAADLIRTGVLPGV